jgi:UDP-N-acetylglucosamine 2-epimerase
MYESFFGLKEGPFQLNPDPAFYFGSRGHSSAFSYLKYGVHQAEGFIVITGEIGAGKTTIVRAMMEQLDSREVVAAQLVNTQLDDTDVLRAVAGAFGLPIKAATKAELLATIEAFLTLLVTRRQRALLIVDEAQNLSPESIEELRMLSNFQLGKKPLLQSFLVGQPELRDKLRAPQLEQLRQRVIASYHLGPMDEPETRAYIEHRMRHVGWVNDPQIESDTYPVIFSWTHGLPRKINLMCNRLLLSAYLEGRHVLRAEDAMRVIEELRNELGGGMAPLTSPRLTAPVVRAPAQAPAPQAQDHAQAPAVAEAAKTPINLPKPLAVHEEDGPEPTDRASRRIRRERTLAKPGATLGPIVCVMGNRPDIVKMSPIVRAIDAHPKLPNAMVVYTGLRTDFAMSEQLFADLELHLPDFDLEVGDGTALAQMSALLKRLEPVLDELRPSALLVVGSADVTLACALVAAKKQVPVIRVEAGLRSFDRNDPGEVNRVMIDHASNLFLTTEYDARINLAREGISAKHIEFVGSPTVDALLKALDNSVKPVEVMRSAGLDASFIAKASAYGVVTLHRQSIVNDREALLRAIKAICKASEELPLVWPIHPDTRARIEQFGLQDALSYGRVALMSPQGYFEMLGLLSMAAVVLTDSEAVQEECTVLRVPCMSMRVSTERPITVEVGTNTLVGLDGDALQSAVKIVLGGHGKRGRVPELWDGMSSERIATALQLWYEQRGATRPERVNV